MNRRLFSRAALLTALAAGITPMAHAQLLRRLFGRRSDNSTTSDDPLDATSGAAHQPMVLPPGARSELNLAYGDDPAQRLDVYLPASPERSPIILMVHGGAWMVGDKANGGVVNAKVEHWLPKNYIVASANYRMTRPPSPLQQAEDVALALAFTQKHAVSWGGDPTRVVLMGHSSGAHLVVLLAADPSIAARAGAQPWLGTISLDSAALDVVALMQRDHPRFYDRVFGADHARWESVSPMQRLSGRPQPMLLVCSSKRDDSCPSAEAFSAKVRAIGGRVETLPVDLRHGAVNTELGTGSDYTARVDTFLRSLGLA